MRIRGTSQLYFKSIQVDKNQIHSSSAVALQRSVLDRTLSIQLYEDVPRENIPESAQSIAYADDDLEICNNDTVEAIDRWIKRNSLNLATEKTKAVLICLKRRPPRAHQLHLKQNRDSNQ